MSCWSAAKARPDRNGWGWGVLALRSMVKLECYTNPTQNFETILSVFAAVGFRFAFIAKTRRLDDGGRLCFAEVFSRVLWVEQSPEWVPPLFKLNPRA